MSAERHRTSVGLQQAAQHRQSRGLAGTVRPEQADGFTGANLEGHIVDGDPAAVVLLQVADREHSANVLFRVRCAPATSTRATILALVMADPAIPILLTLHGRTPVGIVPIAAITMLRIASLDRQPWRFRRQPASPLVQLDQLATLLARNDRHRVPR